MNLNMDTNNEWYAAAAAYRNSLGSPWCASFNAQQKSSNSSGSVGNSNYLSHSQFNGGLNALNAGSANAQQQVNNQAANPQQMQQAHHNNNLFNFPLTPPKDVTPDSVSNAVAAVVAASISQQHASSLNANSNNPETSSRSSSNELCNEVDNNGSSSANCNNGAENGSLSNQDLISQLKYEPSSPNGSQLPLVPSSIQNQHQQQLLFNNNSNGGMMLSGWTHPLHLNNQVGQQNKQREGNSNPSSSSTSQSNSITNNSSNANSSNSHLFNNGQADSPSSSSASILNRYQSQFSNQQYSSANQTANSKYSSAYSPSLNAGQQSGGPRSASAMTNSAVITDFLSVYGYNPSASQNSYSGQLSPLSHAQLSMGSASLNGQLSSLQLQEQNHLQHHLQQQLPHHNNNTPSQQQNNSQLSMAQQQLLLGSSNSSLSSSSSTANTNYQLDENMSSCSNSSNALNSSAAPNGNPNKSSLGKGCKGRTSSGKSLSDDLYKCDPC